MHIYKPVFNLTYIRIHFSYFLTFWNLACYQMVGTSSVQMRMICTVTQHFNDVVPMVTSRILIIKKFSWLVYVDNPMIPPSNDVLSAFQSALNTSVFLISLIETLHTSSNICLGNHDDMFTTIAIQKNSFLLMCKYVVAG